MTAETPVFPMLCAICGARDNFIRGDHRSPREAYPCPNCKATLRYRDQAAVILDEFGQGQHLSINRLASSGLLDDLKIYEPALHGPFVKTFGGLPEYRRSYFWDGGSPGEQRNGVEFQDLTALTFPSETFDMVLTSDVMEHVFEPLAAFAEIARVLKVGGVHIFSIPTDWPLPRESVHRARMHNGSIENILPERFHRAGDGSPSLVTIDYGADLIYQLEQFRLQTRIVRRSFPIDEAYRNATFIARKLA